MPERFQPAVYLVKDAARILKTSEWNIYEMIKRDEIHGVFRIGTKIRIARDAFDAQMGVTPVAEEPTL